MRQIKTVDDVDIAIYHSNITVAKSITLSLNTETTMEAKTRRGKRSRPSADTTQAAAASASLEESANALANVEGAMSSGSGATPSNKRDKAASKLSKAITNKERSESIDQLISVAGSLLRDSTATAAAIAESNSASQAAAAAATAATLTSVPNPIDSRQEPSQGIVKSEQPPQLPPVATSTATSSSQPPKKRQRESKKNKQSETASAAKATASNNNNNNAASSDSDTAKKTQIQYNPDVPMTKEQLTAWRREMRRVRNRESAAASRRKVRDRIEELEEEVEVWKKRYEEVMRRLQGGDNDDDDTNNIGGIRGNENDGLGDVDGGEGKSEEV